MPWEYKLLACVVVLYLKFITNNVAYKGKINTFEINVQKQIVKAFLNAQYFTARPITVPIENALNPA